MLNNNEKKFISVISEAEKYVHGELELDCRNEECFAMDYRKNLGGVFPIEIAPYNLPLITKEEAKIKNIDIVKCCDECRIFYVEQ